MTESDYALSHKALRYRPCRPSTTKPATFLATPPFKDPPLDRYRNAGGHDRLLFLGVFKNGEPDIL